MKQNQPPGNGRCPSCGSDISNGGTVIDIAHGEELCKCGQVIRQGLFADLQVKLPVTEELTAIMY